MAVLNLNGLMPKENYTHATGPSLTPIVPVGSEAELTDFDQPYIVYGYTLDADADMPECGSGSLSFVIYSTKARDIGQIVTVLKHTFERLDNSASDLNNFTTNYVPASGGDHIYLGMRFGSINVPYSEISSPAETEGGRESGVVNIRFEYYVDYDIDTIVPTV